MIDFFDESGTSSLGLLRQFAVLVVLLVLFQRPTEGYSIM